MHRLKAVLFDHDGTLVDSEAVHLQLWQDILAQEGYALSLAQFKTHCVGIPTPATAQNLAGLFGLSDASGSPIALEIAAGLAKRKSLATTNWLKHNAFPLMPYVREAISMFAGAGYQLAVVTGAGRDGIASTLQAHGLASAFCVVVTGADVRRSKPQPDCYLRAVELLGLSVDDCISFEDTDNGVRASRAAGVRCIGVRNTFTNAHRFEGVEALFDTLQEASHWLMAKYLNPPAQESAHA